MLYRYLLPWLMLVTVSVPIAWGSDEAWVIGKWELVYDPDNSEKDWLEFLPNGDVYNIWPDGTKISGIYVVTAKGVKAVFTYNGKDLITTFHVDEQYRHLKIVTSPSGTESVYRKMKASH